MTIQRPTSVMTLPVRKPTLSNVALTAQCLDSPDRHQTPIEFEASIAMPDFQEEPIALPGPNPATMATRWLLQLRTLVKECVATISAAHDARDQERRDELKAFQATSQQLVDQLDSTESHAESAERDAYEAAASHWQRELTELDAASRRAISEVEQSYEAERDTAIANRDETTWLVGSLLDEQSNDSPRQQLQRLNLQIDGAETVLQESVRTAEQQREQAAQLLERCRLSTEVGLAEPAPPPVTLSGLQERCQAEVQLVSVPYQRLRSMWLPRCFAGAMPVLLWLVFTAAVACPAWLLLDPGLLSEQTTRSDTGYIALIVGSSAALALVVLLTMHMIANQRVFPLITEIFAHSRAAHAMFAKWQRLAAEELAEAHQELDRKHGRRKLQRDEALSKAESEYAARLKELDQWRHQEIQRLQTYRNSRKQQLERERDVQLGLLTQQSTSSATARQRHRQDQFSFLEAHHRTRLAEIDDAAETATQAAVARWQSELKSLTDLADQWQREIRQQAPSWDDLTPSARNVFPSLLPLGNFEVSLADVARELPQELQESAYDRHWQLPAAIDLTETPALLLQYRDTPGRLAAAQGLQTAMLRLLTLLPAGQVRFTILDPLSLGENFATFMHLADFDELLVNTRIWTEPGQIEEQLAELTEHMETVLQMFLRNDFATLEEYNRIAGEVAEPYRVLVISGLPTSFSDLAMRRLWNIVNSGARCGLIPLIAADGQALLPRGFQLSDLKPFVNELTYSNSAWHWQLPELKPWPIQFDAPPAPGRFGELVKICGQLAGDVRRVEVPFQRVAPDDQKIWTFSADRKLSIPIGRSGATRTQSLDLGQGTSQHVLIAGKTGSGKSTLMHAIITNAALHYSPDELSLYLIDFKKGVEFKVYARQRLPHARVVGIESDREFGVSVLEQLDRELQERSSAFRDAGVADLAGFRQARPEAPMPRVLLMIDEFQEFFVDDDSLSQQAALLLDRLIRQGRAFGVHAILGSQTLAGAYSLARSTLGQVAVRIALQCSESDAHLILSEENTAARLLTRPGEAIYNDANGLSGGNHLFQVVWLDNAERDRHLERLQGQARATGRTFPPAIVFEGNVPADIQNLPASRQTALPLPTAWLGEAVSLRGPIGVEFSTASGSHLLIVGQDELAATGMLAAGAISFHGTAQADSTELLIFNGSPHPATGAVWQEIAAQFPGTRLPSHGELDMELQKLVDLVRERDGVPGTRKILCLFDLVRFRKLRKKDDDFGFGGFDKKESSPADRMAEILRDGPTVGVHVWIWCDSINTLGRWLSRDMQQQLEYRVALAMNANDSSQLIDSPAAGRLGANRAWLYRGDRGTLDKFRPYTAPQPADIAKLARRTDPIELP